MTIFVPYDCKNHCLFYVKKGKYADLTVFSTEKICASIRRMETIISNCDFVLTGGETFANLESLQMMLDEIPTIHKVHINTTLPVPEHQSKEDILAIAERNNHKVTCINVSRHMQHYMVESNDGRMARLPDALRLPIRLQRHGSDLPQDAALLHYRGDLFHGQCHLRHPL